ncbi:MAG: hypothetical protein H6810_00370 [Phycisphaeraceae bacterium]|nr:MAG: hypothetical protein H6810_00370 [Phycisphaeraceae bacterium]
MPGNPIDDEGALDETVADVELEESLDQVEPAKQPVDVLDRDLGGFDPEAGRQRVGGRITITGHLTSDAGMFVIGLVTALVGLSVLIYAIVNRTTTSWIVAGVIAPPTLLWAFVKWRRWMGGAPYVYRMLLSLDEKEAAAEAMERHQERQKKRLDKKLAELEAKGIRIED